MELSAISGTTAADIADELRDLIERGDLAPGDALPPVRQLGEHLGVNRNTVVAAYRLLTAAGLVQARGRAGTRVVDHSRIAQEGYSPDSVLRDVGTGNPDAARIPDPTGVLMRISGRPVLYGEPVIDEELASWASDWIAEDLDGERNFRITVTGGAVDAVERLLAQALVRDDLVALEDPCFLATIHTVRLAGYQPVSVPVDAEGMTVDGLRTALEAGVRAVLVTPRAQNPTGASLTSKRAADLRALLADYPYVLVIEDDHFSLLSQQPYASIIGPSHKRWAVIRSMSKFLGPDMCLAVAATDPGTADRLALRLSPGTTWVSHLLQRLTVGLITDPSVAGGIRAAGKHYADRNRHVAALLSDRGLSVTAADGLNLWVHLPVEAARVTPGLMKRGWLARSGDEFNPSAGIEGSHFLRLTVHDLDDADAERFANDLAAAVAAA